MEMEEFIIEENDIKEEFDFDSEPTETNEPSIKENTLSVYIQNHISYNKQQEDQGWDTYFKDTLTAAGETDIINKVNEAIKVFEESGFTAAVATFPEAFQQAYGKLIKVRVRMNWIAACIGVYKATGGVDVTYPEFPIFDS